MFSEVVEPKRELNAVPTRVVQAQTLQRCVSFIIYIIIIPFRFHGGPILP